jgi:hypothetical protein
MNKNIMILYFLLFVLISLVIYFNPSLLSIKSKDIETYMQLWNKNNPFQRYDWEILNNYEFKNYTTQNNKKNSYVSNPQHILF